jgi:hypothetical protein
MPTQDMTFSEIFAQPLPAIMAVGLLILIIATALREVTGMASAVRGLFRKDKDDKSASNGSGVEAVKAVIEHNRSLQTTVNNQFDLLRSQQEVQNNILKTQQESRTTHQLNSQKIEAVNELVKNNEQAISTLSEHVVRMTAITNGGQTEIRLLVQSIERKQDEQLTALNRIVELLEYQNGGPRTDPPTDRPNNKGGSKGKAIPLDADGAKEATVDASGNGESTGAAA